jgi:hypothetical protein
LFDVLVHVPDFLAPEQKLLLVSFCLLPIPQVALVEFLAMKVLQVFSDASILTHPPHFFQQF